MPYIKRETLLELFDDSCKYARPTNDYQRGCNEVFDWCVRMIKNAPFLLVSGMVEVVRCRDCGYYWLEHLVCKGLPTEPMVQRFPDDYCSRGERK